MKPRPPNGKGIDSQEIDMLPPKFLRPPNSFHEVARQAVEYHIDDFEDLSRSIEVLRDPSDPVLDWEVVKRDLLLTGEGGIP